MSAFLHGSTNDPLPADLKGVIMRERTKKIARTTEREKE